MGVSSAQAGPAVLSLGFTAPSAAEVGLFCRGRTGRVTAKQAVPSPPKAQEGWVFMVSHSAAVTRKPTEMKQGCSQARR